MRLLTEARWTLANLADDGLFPASWSVRYYIVVVTGHQTGLVLTQTQPVDTLLWLHVTWSSLALTLRK